MKRAAYDAQNIAANHLTKAHPAIAQTPAKAVKARDVAAVLRSLVDAGKGRTAAKLRSYLRAAYALAARAETDSEVPTAFIAFGCESNPVATTGALSKFNQTRERALSHAELRAYHAAIKALPDSATRDALLLGLLLGGQRTAQLVRVNVADVNLAERTITLRDPKGKRARPRLHVLPLTDAALEVVNRGIVRGEELRAKKAKAPGEAPKGPQPLLTNDGKAHIVAETAINLATDVATALLAKPKAERVIGEAFRLGDIRRRRPPRLRRGPITSSRSRPVTCARSSASPSPDVRGAGVAQRLQ